MRIISDNILGQSNIFIDVLEQVSKIAPLHKPVLVLGERGTGKEQIAHRLHYLSERWQAPFISLNCATLNDNLLDSELFGHEAGSFTGAQHRHQGRFERSHGGTLFLDELGNMSMRVQEKLLRVIEYGEFERVGGSKSIRVDVRLICATNDDLPALCLSGKFRPDLLDRLAFDVINLPPLREREGDIMLLAEHFAIQMSQELSLAFFPGFTQTAKQTLLNYAWPGNIRELKNAVERSMYRHSTTDYLLDNIVLNPFKSIPSSSPEATSKEENIHFPIQLKSWLQQQEQQVIQQALEKSQFNQRKAAELLGLTYHQLRGILRKNDALT